MSRLAEFTSRAELVNQTGHAIDEWPLVQMKELVDNAIDAAEEAGVPPMVEIAVSSTGITVTDNGAGLGEEAIVDILDYSSRTSSREAYVSPTRGAQGNALETLLAMPFVLDGQRGRHPSSKAEAWPTRSASTSTTFAGSRVLSTPVVRLL